MVIDTRFMMWNADASKMAGDHGNVIIVNSKSAWQSKIEEARTRGKIVCPRPLWTQYIIYSATQLCIDCSCLTMLMIVYV